MKIGTERMLRVPAVLLIAALAAVGLCSAVGAAETFAEVEVIISFNSE